MLTKVLLINLADYDYKQHLPANPIRLLQQEATHHNKRFVMAETIHWTKIFEDTNYPAILDLPSSN